MTVLVTGATGFLGSAIARELLSDGRKVRVLLRPEADRRNLEGLDVELAFGDLRDIASLDKALVGCETLFHAAAYYSLWSRDRQAMYDINVEGTRNILTCAQAAGVKRVVYTSSVATLGLPKSGAPGDEQTPVALADMIGHYKRSKFLAEEVVREHVHARALDAVIVSIS